MDKRKAINKQRSRRQFHVRKRVHGTTDRPRLCVFRSHKHLYCQVIDDLIGKTIVSASTRDKDIAGEMKYGGNCDAAKLIGKAVAERALEKGVKAVRFDRGKNKYHGRIAALADAARESGLKL